MSLLINQPVDYQTCVLELSYPLITFLLVDVYTEPFKLTVKRLI